MQVLTPGQARFVTEAGFADQGWEALPSDASPRRYLRLTQTQQGSVLLMVTEPDAPDVPPYIAIARHLLGLGLSAPRILSARPDLGLVLIEDFGDSTYTNLLAGGADEAGLYALAIDALIALHNHEDGAAIDLPPYDAARLLSEVSLLPDWFAPAHRPDHDATALGRDHADLWQAALADVAERREVLVLRDYHVDNLLLLEARDGVARCGLLDFQDGLIGAAAYDVMSLTQDARRDVSAPMEAAMVDRYLAGRPGLDANAFLRDYHLLAAQRHAKVAGIFHRLAKRDGKPHYLTHMPRVLRLLDNALARAGLGDIRALLDQHLPGWSGLPEDQRVALAAP